MPPTPSPSPRPSVPPAESHLVHLIQQTAGWVAHRPWLAGVAAAAVVAGIAVDAAVRGARHRRLARHAHQVLITPPPEVDPAGAGAWWANLYELLAPAPWRRLLHGAPHVAVEYRWAGRQLTIVVWVPGTVATGPIAAAARAAWPGASTTVADADAPMPERARAEGGALAPALPAWYPLEVDHDADPTRALVAAGSGLHATERAC